MPKPVATLQQMSLHTARPDEAVPINHLPSSPWHQKLPKWPVSLLPHNPGLILGWTQAPSTMKYFNCMRRWTGPWGIYLQPWHPWMPATESRYWTSRLLSIKMRPKLLKSLRTWGPIVQLQSTMLRLCAQQLSGRQRPPVQSVSTSYNNHMGNVCRKWRGKLLRRKGGIASVFQLPAEQCCRSVPQKHIGYSYALYNCWWGTCPWPLSWPYPPSNPLP